MPDENPTEAKNQSHDDVFLLATALPQVMEIFKSLPQETRGKLLLTLNSLFSTGQAAAVPNKQASAQQPAWFSQSQQRDISPKEFLMEKKPTTDVERVAVLAYYLTHFRETPYFRTLDISKLNTEAAQMKFSNAAKSVDNATAYGYLAPATKGNKQLSAAGEMFVRALPDRDEAKSAMSHARPRRKRRGSRSSEEEQSGS